MDEAVSAAIIGAGPGGIAAAIYLQRAGVAPLLIERGEPGGLLRSANLVENYPGFPGGVRGVELAERFVDQLRSSGVRVTRANVELVSAVRDGFRVKTDMGDFSCRTVIIATGTRPKEIGLRGCGRLNGKKVFYDIAEIPPELRKDKSIIVVGGGDAAFDYALNLRGKGNRVTVISRSEPHCLPLLRSRAKSSGIDVVTGCVPELVQEKPKGVLLRCRSENGRADFRGDLVLSACGRVPDLSILSPALRRQTRTGKGIPETRAPGMYIVGDAARGRHRQTGIAVGDGIRAAMLVDEFLKWSEGRD
ncbi:MAG: NAD(P)/FAD-dependent oxidoreductase [Thermoplasmata archaeon]